MADERGHDTFETRRLDETDSGETWQIVYVSIVLVYIFGALLSERVAPDSVMLAGLTLCMVAEIVTIKEGVAGFSNEGVLTVMALFVVANGISVTGALDWYMGKLLGRPKTVSGAQLRMMIPVCIASCFLNNTPIVAVMIPIISRWGKNIHVAPQQLMALLSFAVILGGTCTLIGTSTNLVVSGLMEKRYPDNEPIGIFELGQYGVPVAMIGIAYMLFAAPLLLPGAKGRAGDNHGFAALDSEEDILLGARLTQWSPAAGRSVKRSGLRDTGGIYLVSVHRAATGNVHRAVGQDFVLNVGDALYFTGLVEEFGNFCEEHGLEMITNEVDLDQMVHDPEAIDEGIMTATNEEMFESDETEQLRRINAMTDLIREDRSLNLASNRLGASSRPNRHRAGLEASAPPEVVVTRDDRDSQRVVIVGINAPDRPGLLLDISKGLQRLNLQLHHSEAAVVEERSFSIWRCEFLESSVPDIEEVWTILIALLESEKGVQAVKKRGLKVIRGTVMKESRLDGQVLGEINFRKTYKAAIVAVQQDGRNTTQALSSLTLHSGDVLVLQASDDSPLLISPPEDFYTTLASSIKNQSSVKSVVRSQINRSGTSGKDESKADADVEEGNVSIQHAHDSQFPEADPDGNEAVWRDLMVLATDGQSREFLVAMQVEEKSSFIYKTVAQGGLRKLTGVFLVSIERPVDMNSGDGIDSVHLAPAFTTIDPADTLEAGDVLWFAGSASAVGDLRKIPGLVSFESDEVKKMKEKVFDRRLVQAVVSRNAPLVGKTVKEVTFRTRYGAAVIAVHRDGRRIHDYPGNIKLHAGDVLLLEAGPTFLARSGADKDNSFVLLAEVENSAPPRLRFVIPAVLLAATMIILNVLEVISLLIGALLVAVVMVTIGLMSEQEARESVHWDVFIAVASAFGIGTALSNSGFAGGVASILVAAGESLGIGVAGILGAVYLATILICNVLPHNAAAALIFPIALGAADEGGVDTKVMAFCVMLGASANFVSPFSYQTNLMVFGPGGYKTIDFVKFGTPMQLVLWIVTVGVLSVKGVPWYACWIISLLVLLLVAVVRLTNGSGLHVINSLRGHEQ